MLNGKNAIITGARSGIGLATLQLFAKQGANCWAIVHRDDPDFLTKVESLQEEYKVWIRAVNIDLSDSNSIKSGIKEIIQEKKTIDVLVNAAGIVSPNRLFSMTKIEDMRRIMDVNFFSILETIQLTMRVMQRQRKGSIINIASIAADCEDSSQLEYSASKAALVCATKKLARELAPSGIRVNAVSPGWTETGMLEVMDNLANQIVSDGLPMHTYANPDEIASVCLFLASDFSSRISGANIKVDGGGFDLRTFISKQLEK